VGPGEAGEAAETLPAVQRQPGDVDRQYPEAAGRPADGQVHRHPGSVGSRQPAEGMCRFTPTRSHALAHAKHPPFTVITYLCFYLCLMFDIFHILNVQFLLFIL